MIRELTSAASIGTASPEQQPIFPFSFVVLLLLSRYFFGGFFRFLGFVILFDLPGPRRDLSGLLLFVFCFFLLLFHLELSSCRCFFSCCCLIASACFFLFFFVAAFSSATLASSFSSCCCSLSFVFFAAAAAAASSCADGYAVYYVLKRVGVRRSTGTIRPCWPILSRYFNKNHSITNFLPCKPSISDISPHIILITWYNRGIHATDRSNIV